MIRLYNHTRYSEAVIRDCLTFAARMAKVKGDVPVKITYSRQQLPGGYAHRNFPYRKTLIGKPTASRDRRTLNCPIGWVEMRLPRTPVPVLAARRFVDTAIHEMVHIRQYRTYGFRFRAEFNGYRSGSKRRMEHDSRPCEIEAENVVYDVQQNPKQNKRRQELIASLAVALGGLE